MTCTCTCVSSNYVATNNIHVCVCVCLTDTYDEEKWLDGRRDERVDEFAPPQAYYNDDDKPTRFRSAQSSSKFVPPSLRKLSQRNAAAAEAFDDDDHIFGRRSSSKKSRDPMALLEQYVIDNESETAGECPKSESETAPTAAPAAYDIYAGVSAIRRQVEIQQAPYKIPVTATVSTPVCDNAGHVADNFAQPPPPPPAPPAGYTMPPPAAAHMYPPW